MYVQNAQKKGRYIVKTVIYEKIDESDRVCYGYYRKVIDYIFEKLV